MKTQMSAGFYALAAAAITIAPAHLSQAQTARAQTAGAQTGKVNSAGTKSAKPQQEIAIPSNPSRRVILSEVYTGKVRRVVDGRTLVVDQDGRDRTVRLFGVEAPDKNRLEATKTHLSDRVKERTVRVEARARDEKGVTEAVVFVVPIAQPRAALRPLDPTGTSSDLPRGADAGPSTAVAPASLKADNPSLNESAVREGLVRWSRVDAPEEKMLADAEQAAMKDKKGLWVNK